MEKKHSFLGIKNQKVILDADLAKLYGVTTKRLNQQVKRNRDRFPEDFMFQLTSEEKMEVVANCDHLSRLKFSPTSPYAFTAYGAIMAASLLNMPHPTVPQRRNCHKILQPPSLGDPQQQSLQMPCPHRQMKALLHTCSSLFI
ncbi:MAG: ORF6N domain-containing protein, partial [Desulfobacterales bacterium]|nr:ORF6N domain-containing protein [Desulfobacterales bacterium]